jgi:hypothetical protein
MGTKSDRSPMAAPLTHGLKRFAKRNSEIAS